MFAFRAGLIAALLVLPAAAAGQSLTVPEDWTWRLDGEQRLVSGQEVAKGEWRYVQMPPGWHVTTTDRGAFLFPKDRVVSGRWGIEAELFLFPNPSDEPLGVVLEARDAEPAGSQQFRFLMRRDGSAAAVARHGDVDTMVVAWKSDTAVAGHKGGVVRYVLRVMHEAGTLAFSINGREMIAVPTGGREHVVVPGLRVGPGLNLHVSRFDLITPLAPPRPRKEPGSSP